MHETFRIRTIAKVISGRNMGKSKLPAPDCQGASSSGHFRRCVCGGRMRAMHLRSIITSWAQESLRVRSLFGSALVRRSFGKPNRPMNHRPKDARSRRYWMRSILPDRPHHKGCQAEAECARRH
jgi:hypothetical protein